MPRSSPRRIPELPADTPAELVIPHWAKREEWLKGRQGGVGGSEIAALIGASEYMTPFDVFRAKRGTPIELDGIPEIEWGHRLEDAVAKKAADELGMVARTGGGLWRHRDHEFALVTPDRLATRKLSWKAEALIECKTAGSDEDWSDGHAPLGYLAQTQWQLGIMGLRKGWLACLVLGASRDFYLVEVDFDQEWFDEMLEAARQFWYRSVIPWEPPMYDLEHPRTEQILKELHPKPIRPATELSDDAEEWLEAYFEAKDKVDRWTKRLGEIKNYFRMQLQDAQRGYLGDDLIVSYPEVRPKQVSIELLREKYPQIAEECTVRTSHRRMTIARRKPKDE